MLETELSEQRTLDLVCSVLPECLFQPNEKMFRACLAMFLVSVRRDGGRTVHSHRDDEHLDLLLHEVTRLKPVSSSGECGDLENIRAVSGAWGPGRNANELGNKRLIELVEPLKVKKL